MGGFVVSWRGGSEEEREGVKKERKGGRKGGIKRKWKGSGMDRARRK